MSTTKSRIGITLGDCAGIGPEIVDLALKSGRVPDSAEYVVIGRQPNCHPGEPTIETARTAGAALEEAVTLARRGELDAIVTGPVHKARMYDIGFKFPGQTEFFAQRCGIKNFAMCLTAEKITVARTILGRDSSSRSFAMTPETQIDGKLQPKARVTVQYVTKDEMDRAVRIVVRNNDPKK